MGLFGSKPERECKKARKKCEKQRKKCEKQCRRDRRRECRRSPYVVVEEYAGCCPNSCNRSYCHVDCFDPCPRYRVCRTRTCTNTCPVPRSCPSMMNCNPCMSLNSCDPCTQFNNMIASFPPGTDFTQLLATLPSILGTSCSNLAPFPSGLCDPSTLIPYLGSLDPSQLASIAEGVKNANPNLYNSLDLGIFYSLFSNPTYNEFESFNY